MPAMPNDTTTAPRSATRDAGQPPAVPYAAKLVLSIFICTGSVGWVFAGFDHVAWGFSDWGYGMAAFAVVSLVAGIAALTYLDPVE